MTQFDHEAMKGTDLSGEEEVPLELQDVEVEGAAKVGDTVDEVISHDAPSAEEA